MATPVLIPVSEYLTTTYRPDCDYVDGEVKERNVGESPHAALQTLFATFFSIHRKAWGVRALTEQRVQVFSRRFRVADVCVIRLGKPPGPIVTTPPLLCIEILSDGQSLADIRPAIDDYLRMGVEHVWVFDPVRRLAWTASTNGYDELQSGSFAVPGTPIRIPLADIDEELNALAEGR